MSQYQPPSPWTQQPAQPLPPQYPQPPYYQQPPTQYPPQQGYPPQPQYSQWQGQHPYYPPPQQGFLPGPMSPQPRPVRQSIKIAAISVFAVAIVLAFVHETQLGGLFVLASFILMFFI